MRFGRQKLIDKKVYLNEDCDAGILACLVAARPDGPTQDVSIATACDRIAIRDYPMTCATHRTTFPCPVHVRVTVPAPLVPIECPTGTSPA
jgi:hypothetical protein